MSLNAGRESDGVSELELLQERERDRESSQNRWTQQVTGPLCLKVTLKDILYVHTATGSFNHHKGATGEVKVCCKVNEQLQTFKGLTMKGT